MAENHTRSMNDTGGHKHLRFQTRLTNISKMPQLISIMTSYNVRGKVVRTVNRKQVGVATRH